MKTVPAYIIAIIGMYISLNAVLAIPMLDENNSKLKEMGSDLKDQLNSAKLALINNLNTFRYDSIINSRFDSACKKLGIKSSSQSLTQILSNKLNNYRISFENGSDLIYDEFIDLNSTDNISELFIEKSKLCEAYTLKCDSAEKEVSSYLDTIRININKFYSYSQTDTPDKRILANAYNAAYVSIYETQAPFSFFDPLHKEKNKDPFNSFFYISNKIVQEGSSNINMIVAIFGVALFGSIIGGYRRNTLVKAQSTNPLAIDTGPTLFKSFSASLLTYLAIKGGISFIAADKSTEINPYFIMLICFAAAVYSDEIWVWAKNKLIPGNPPPP